MVICGTTTKVEPKKNILSKIIGEKPAEQPKEVKEENK